VFAGKIFVPKKGEVSKQLRIFHSEVRYWHRSYGVVSLISAKDATMGWAFG
jgi:hypothetical protein